MKASEQDSGRCPVHFRLYDLLHISLFHFSVKELYFFTLTTLEVLGTLYPLFVFATTL